MGSMRPIDLRSDTVTRPDDEMRAAMAAAEVDDDVIGRDPTMQALEERVADLLGVEAALWVPTGCMGNSIAMLHHLDRGDAFLAPEGSHVVLSELGSPAWLAGAVPIMLPRTGGHVRLDAIPATAGTPGPYYALHTKLLCLENTHNGAGGAVTSVADHHRLVDAARAAGLAVHLDGARIWNASVALGVKPAELAAGVDTVQVCMSKGLGAPVGSLVCGTTEFVAGARRFRKMLGGGVRQGGVLAAAGLVALDHIDDLAVDHDNAKRLAVGLVERGWTVTEPESNIVLGHVDDVPAMLRRLAEQGVLATTMSGAVRFVTHRDVTTADIDEALARLV